jgi:hypothetical protein
MGEVIAYEDTQRSRRAGETVDEVFTLDADVQKRRFITHVTRRLVAIRAYVAQPHPRRELLVAADLVKTSSPRHGWKAMVRKLPNRRCARVSSPEGSHSIGAA